MRKATHREVKEAAMPRERISFQFKQIMGEAKDEIMREMKEAAHRESISSKVTKYIF